LGVRVFCVDNILRIKDYKIYFLTHFLATMMVNVRVVLLVLGTFAFTPCWAFVVQPNLLVRHPCVFSAPSMSSSSSVSNDNNNDINNNLQVTVVGGTGFVGSRVCQILVEQGASVRSISKTGTVPKWCRDEPWTNQVTWTAVDLLEASSDSLDAAMGTPAAVVSCVGAIGTDPDVLKRGNGDANVAAFQSAKRRGATRAAFISVSSELVECREDFLPEFMGAYFDGKAAAEAAAADAVGSDALTLIQPTFIYGGNSFGLNPPRVTADYGAIIDQLLSFLPIQILADLLPGLAKIALRPPVSVDAVAGACAAAALGQLPGGQILDGSRAINAVTNIPSSTGLTDAIVREVTWMAETSTKVATWMSARLKEQAMTK
jgi:nucleoside-diphosphate-sugar epimerase